MRRRQSISLNTIFIILLSLLLFIFPFIISSGDALLVSMLGRLHPLIVHFPVVVIPLTLFVEWRLSDKQNNANRLLLSFFFTFSFISTVAALGAGFFLAASGDYQGAAVQKHMWFGVFTALFLIWCLHYRQKFLLRPKKRFKDIYRFFLWASLVSIIFTGHFGGSLTHGSDYLTEPIIEARERRAIARTEAVQNPASMQVFDDLIHPILEDKCNSCHNDSKQKGGLNMSQYETLMKGGDGSRPMVVSGSAEDSEWIRRVTLDQDHDDFMPPDGKPPLDQGEIDIIKWWINGGAAQSDTLGRGLNDPEIKETIESFLPQLAQAQALAAAQRLERIKVGPRLARLGTDIGLVIRPDQQSDSAYFTISMTLPPKLILDETLRELMPYKDVFSRVSLVSSEVTDEGLYYLGQMSNLKELILAKTCINGEGLDYLKSLNKLTMINLSHSHLTNSALLEFTDFSALEQAYVFNTFVDKNFVDAVNQHHNEKRIKLEEGPYF